MKRITIKAKDNSSEFSHDYTDIPKEEQIYISEDSEKRNKTYLAILNRLIGTFKNENMSAFSCDKSNSLVQNKTFWGSFWVKDLKKKFNNCPNPDLFKFYENGNGNEEFTITGIKGFAGVVRNVIKWCDKGTEQDVEVTLEVRSRFDEENKPWFLATMLSQFITGEDGQVISTNNEVWKGDMEIFGFLSAVLFQNLLKRAYESGIYKTYVRIEHNDEKLRGTIDIARHLRLNAGRNDAVIAYNTREHSYNNMLNHLIIITWDCLRTRYSGICDNLEKDTEFMRAIKNIEGFIGGKRAELSRCVNACRHSITGPYYTDYEELRKLCLNILRNEVSANIFSGNSDQNVCGIVIYTPDLWEKYLERAMRAKLPEHITLKAQEKLDTYMNYINNTFGKSTRPDYVFYSDKNKNDAFFILDAKFKIFDAKEENNKTYAPWEVVPADNADYDKLLRDMVNFCAHAAAIIYPYRIITDEKKDNENKVKVQPDYKNKDYTKPHLLSTINSTDHFYHFPVIIPHNTDSGSKIKDWKDWCSELENETSSTVSQVIKVLETEKQRSIVLCRHYRLSN